VQQRAIGQQVHLQQDAVTGAQYRPADHALAIVWLDVEGDVGRCL